MSNYNKYTPGSIKRLGCGQCGQKEGYHASYCPYNPDRQKFVAAQLQKSQEALKFIDLWQAIKELRQRVSELEKQ